MAGFINSNALEIGNENVDTTFSPLLEANLWQDSIFEAGRTFTDKYMEDEANQIFVRKLGKGTVDRTSSLTFTHNQTADELIPIVLDEPFKQSEAVYEEVNVARSSGKGAQKMEVVVRNVNEEWQKVAMDKLVAGATASSDTTATTAETVKAQIISVRKELRENHAKPTVLLVSPRIYAFLQEFSGKEFQLAYNDEVIRTGQLGSFLGLPVYEATYLEDNGASGDVEFIMYDHEAYSILTRLIASRLIPAGKDWVGSAAQVQIKSGFKVTTPDRVIKHAIA